MESPFNLTYGTNAMLPVEVRETIVQRQLTDLALNKERLRSNLDVFRERRDGCIGRGTKKIGSSQIQH